MTSLDGQGVDVLDGDGGVDVLEVASGDARGAGRAAGVDDDGGGGDLDALVPSGHRDPARPDELGLAHDDGDLALEHFAVGGVEFLDEGVAALEGLGEVRLGVVLGAALGG